MNLIYNYTSLNNLKTIFNEIENYILFIISIKI